MTRQGDPRGRLPTDPDPEACGRILTYLREAFERNPQAETPGLELERELGLTHWTVRDCLEYLAAIGAVSGDLFPINAWVRWAGGDVPQTPGAGGDSPQTPGAPGDAP